MRKTTPAPERFWPKVQKTQTCWLWTAAQDHTGYGLFRVDPQPAMPVKAHRFAFELLRGPIPAGHELDHLCRVRHCVNPSHIEPVTGAVNTLRGYGPTAINARKTHCVNGHELPPRVGDRRRCLVCKRESCRRYRAKLRQAS